MSLSRKRIDRAGLALREWWSSGEEVLGNELAEDIDIAFEFRAEHQGPLTQVAANLRYYVNEASPGAVFITQRLKRMPTVVEKLARLPTMKLSRMEDIGGCRAVLQTQEEVDLVVGRLREQRRWQIHRERDYVRSPKDDGYRAVHLVVRRSDVFIEVQLRTALQHAWAEMIERADRSYAFGLKTGRATVDVREYFRLGAHLLDQQEQGHEPSRNDLEAFRALSRVMARHRGHV